MPPYRRMDGPYWSVWPMTQRRCHSYAKTMDSPSPLIVACLVLLTVAWPVSAWQMFQYWHHRTTFFDVPNGPAFLYRRARARSLPVAVGAGLPFLTAAWLFVASPPSQHGTANPAQIAAVVLFMVAGVLIVGIAPLIFLVNRPRRLVPPHLRAQPGYLEDRRGISLTAPSH